MNRRLTLQALFVVGTAPLGTVVTAQSSDYPAFCSPRIDARRKDAFLLKPRGAAFPALRRVYAASPIILAGDPDHSNGRPELFFFSRQNLQAIVDAGKKHLFLEVPQEYQEVFDMLADGRLKPDQIRLKSPWLGRNMNLLVGRATAEGIAFLGKHGIKTHALDATNNESSEEDNETYDDHVDGVIAFAKEQCPERPSLHTRIVNAYKKSTGQKADASAVSRVLQARDDDSAHVKLIGDLSKGEPSIVRMGNDHFLNAPRSIKTLLGAQTIHVAFFANTTALANPDDLPPAESLPDFVVLTENLSLHQTGTRLITGLNLQTRADRPANKP